MTHESWVLGAFPRALHPDAAEVAGALERPSVSSGGATLGAVDVVVVDGEVLTIPYRVYCNVAPADRPFVMPRAHEVADCVRTRHHDGWVRQDAVRRLLAGPSGLLPWVVPYVVQLVGEYVVEIIDDIAEALTEVDVEGSAQQRAYGRVLADNPELLRLTRARSISYWSCYYRGRHHRLAEHPGHRLAEAFARAAALAEPREPRPRGEVRR
jgi:hypothetical protein